MGLESCENVVNRCSRVTPSTGERYVRILRGCLGWMGENGGELAVLGPDDLVEFQRVHRDYRALDLVQRYILGLKG